MYLHGQAWDSRPTPLTRQQAGEECYWSLWRRRLAPYGALAPGDRVLVVDTFRRVRTVAWEYEAVDVSHEPYGSLAEAARLISSGSAQSRG